MDNLFFLQHYWWLVITLLGSILVFLMFVQGGQSLLLGTASNEKERTLLVNTFGHKWEITFTTLVTFGGAAFAAFPLFYSTSFGSAYWLWISILLLFVIQAVSYEYRNKAGNLLGARTYETFLFLNGTLGCILLGVAVGTFFTGGSFIVDKMNLTIPGQTTISYWTNDWKGLDAIVNPFNFLLGIGVFLAARTLGLMYSIQQINDETLTAKCRTRLKVTGAAFIIGFVIILAMFSMLTGLEQHPLTGNFTAVKHKYLLNLTELVWPLVMLVAGVILVIAGYLRSITGRDRHTFYITGLGVILAVWPLLISAGFNNTAYFISTARPECSLTLSNSSSSEFTLKVMAYISIAIPFVIAYIAYAWKALVSKKTDMAELEGEDSHRY